MPEAMVGQRRRALLMTTFLKAVEILSLGDNRLSPRARDSIGRSRPQTRCMLQCRRQ